MEKKYFDIKKLNTTALALLCLAVAPTHSLYGMNVDNDEIKEHQDHYHHH